MSPNETPGTRVEAQIHGPNPPVVKVTVTMTVETTVDPGWIEFVTGGPEGFADIFMTNGHCGYWLRKITHGKRHGNPDLGFLAYDYAAEDRYPDEIECDVAIGLWKAGNTLPKNFHALNLELARKSWVEGVKKDGVEWYENGDGNTYDCAVQRALLGDIVYG